MSSAGITQPKPARIRDLFYSWPFQQLPHPAWGKQQQDQPLHIPADTNPPSPGTGWGLALGFLQSRAGEAEIPTGMGLGALAKGSAICRDGGEKEKRKKKSAKEMNQLLQDRLPELIPILLFPRRKESSGREKGGRKDFLQETSGTAIPCASSWINPGFQPRV